jgi:hypothetical protein
MTDISRAFSEFLFGPLDQYAHLFGDDEIDEQLGSPFDEERA